MPSIRPPGFSRQTDTQGLRSGLLIGLCLASLLVGCGNKGDLYLPGSEADERSLRSIDQVLDELDGAEDEEDAATKLRKVPEGVQEPAAASS